MPFGYHRHPVKAVVTDVTLSRTNGVNYQNTTGRPLLVVISLQCERASVAGACAHGTAKIGATSPPTLVHANSGLMYKDNDFEEAFFALVFMVPNRYYYRIDFTLAGAGSAAAANKWLEVEL